MAETESIGAVAVTITGDYGPLNAALSQAQAIASRAGSSIASAFQSSAGGATQATDGLTQSISRNINIVNAATGEAINFGSAERGVAASADRAAEAISRQAAAAAHGVTQIQATSGALRVLEGSGGIRAAERFLTMIPGLGAALQTAFPVIGAVALTVALIHMGEEAYRAGENFVFLKEAQEAANKISVQYAKDAQSQVEAVERLRAAEADRRGNFVQGESIRQESRNQSPISLPAIPKEIADQLSGSALGPNAQLFSQDQFEKMRENLKDVIPQDLGPRIAAVTRQIGELKSQLVGIQAANPTGNALGIDASANRYALAIDVLSEALKRLKVAQDAANEQNQSGILDAQRKQASEAAKSVEDQIHAAQTANTQAAELAKQHIQFVADMHRQIAQQQINAIGSEAGRRDAAAQADIAKAVELRDRLTAEAITNRDAALGNAGALRKQESATAQTPREQQQVGINFDTRTDTANTDFAKATQPLDQAVDDARSKLADIRQLFETEIAGGIQASFRNIGDGWEKLQKQLNDGARKWGEEMTRVAEIQAKGAGQAATGSFDADKLKVERDLQAQIGATASQRIAAMREIADLEEKSRLAEIGSLETERGIAEAAGEKVRTAQIQLQIDEKIRANQNATYSANTKVQGVQQQTSVGGQIGGAANQAISGLSSAIAKGVFEGGKGIGRDIETSLKSVGQQLFGSLLTKAVEEMVVAITGNTIATSVNNAVTGIHIGVMSAHLAVMVGHLAVMIANTASTIANTIATLIQAALALFGFADGGTPPVGVPSIVGERGPEIFVPHTSGTIVPNHMIKGYADGAALSALPSAGGARASVMHPAAFSGDMHIHIPAQGSPRQHAEAIYRELPKVAKAHSSDFGPYSR